MRRLASRRRFLQTTAAAGAGFWVANSYAAPESTAPNEKLNVAVIGVGGQGGFSLGGVSSQNMVALCDVDSKTLAAAKNRFPRAETYSDFRKLLDQKNVEAVCVCTPDHTHAVAAAAALRSGRHVYCEKPLAHSVYECRVLAGLAKEHKRATQMGTQIHAGDNYRRVVELIQTGAIGPVREAHVWCGKTWSGGERPKEGQPVPANLDWNLWLGPAPERPYHPIYAPANWRRWWDFGGGTLADMGCHYMDVAFWALKLRHPTSVEAVGPAVHAETTPASLTVHWEFPARDAMPACKLSWYDTNARPALVKEGKLPAWGDGVLFVGEKGMLLTDYGRHVLLPESDFAGFKRPEPFIPKSIGHHNEWILACKTGSPTTCNFDYSGALSETVLLGNVAFRRGKKLTWNGEQVQVTNDPEAAALIRREYRTGWTL